MKKVVLACAAALILAGCTHTSQYTSGAAYGAKYSASAYQNGSLIDADVRRISAIEPNLSFPARIGIARIESGRLTTIPREEAHIWQDMTRDLGVAYGEFIPVSPLITDMVRAPVNEKGLRTSTIVDDVRRGSARQHLDHVLIYEVSAKSKKQSNSLRLADLTVLGLYVLPSRNVKIEASASAMLIDVRNGYPYGTASAFAEKDKAVTSAGSRKARSKLSVVARLTAVDNLSQDVETFMQELWVKSAAHKAAQNKAIPTKTGHNRHN